MSELKQSAEEIQQSIKKEILKENMSGTFLLSAIIFLGASIIFFGVAAFKLFNIQIYLSDIKKLNGSEIWFIWLDAFASPIIIILCALICIAVGVYLMRASGVVTQYVIPPHDKDLLSDAIKRGDEKAINEYIRLSSLTGITGTFTKIGLTGLPLATIVLTIILALIGIQHEKFFDLAQLTLGAFIGSYVQKRQEIEQLTGMYTTGFTTPPTTSIGPRQSIPTAPKDPEPASDSPSTLEGMKLKTPPKNEA